MTALDFKRLFEYDNWANQKMLQMLESADNRRALELYSHLLEAHLVWFERIGKIKLSHAASEAAELARQTKAWSIFTNEQCVKITDELKEKWQLLLTQLGDSGLNERFSYTNLKGETFSNSFADVLTHVVNHSTYHRGQVAISLKENGVAIPSTDFIFFARTKQEQSV